jgi:hypothetical protein
MPVPLKVEFAAEMTPDPLETDKPAPSRALLPESKVPVPEIPAVLTVPDPARVETADEIAPSVVIVLDRPVPVMSET